MPKYFVKFGILYKKSKGGACFPEDAEDGTEEKTESTGDLQGSCVSETAAWVGGKESEETKIAPNRRSRRGEL